MATIMNLRTYAVSVVRVSCHVAATFLLPSGALRDSCATSWNLARGREHYWCAQAVSVLPHQVSPIPGPWHSLYRCCYTGCTYRRNITPVKRDKAWTYINPRRKPEPLGYLVVNLSQFFPTHSISRPSDGVPFVPLSTNRRYRLDGRAL